MPYICYIDETGCTTPLPAAATDIQPVLVIVGLVIGVAKVRELIIRFLELKRRFFPKKFGTGNHLLDDVLVEIKGSDLRSSYKDVATGQPQGGVFVNDGLQNRKSDSLFQFPA